MFHGDIKPANIFCPSNPLAPYLTASDSGSVVQLEPENKDIKYFIKYFTPKYSSEKHKFAVLNKTGETADELFQEDKYQLIKTFNEAISKLTEITELTQIMLDMLNNDELSISQIL